jgi:hypothetical protein
MTHKEAKELSLEVWRYHVEHPDIVCNSDLPEGLYSKIKFLYHKCPLCVLFADTIAGCPGCPFSGEGWVCVSKGQPSSRWYKAETPEERREAAEEIVRRIETWVVKK